MSEIVVVANGTSRRCKDGTTVAGFLETLELLPSMVLVEFNGEPLARERYAAVALSDGDRIEIAQMVGGG